jgi:hypothetical protein
MSRVGSFSNEEMRQFLSEVGKKDKEAPLIRSGLVFRKHLSPVDMYSYLKARFGEPFGMMTFLARKDTSDNLFHWDFNLKASTADVIVSGTTREVHIGVSEVLEDDDWVSLLKAIKADFGRVGAEKKKVLESFETWVIFPNKFNTIANVCSELHANVSENLPIKTPTIFPRPQEVSDEEDTKRFNDHMRKVMNLHRDCLTLSLLTPVLVEAFINILILILCKPAVRKNKRQIDAFIRSNIDVKVIDLPYKCNGFTKLIDENSAEFKNFKRVMDNRNNAIHGNVDPVREQIEVVYFEGKRPLFVEPGDHVIQSIEAEISQYNPKKIVQDYEEMHEFFIYLGNLLMPELRENAWHIISDASPGFDLKRNIAGALLPSVRVTGQSEGTRYDDELEI